MPRLCPGIPLRGVKGQGAAAQGSVSAEADGVFVVQPLKDELGKRLSVADSSKMLLNCNLWLALPLEGSKEKSG